MVKKSRRLAKSVIVSSKPHSFKITAENYDILLIEKEVKNNKNRESCQFKKFRFKFSFLNFAIDFHFLFLFSKLVPWNFYPITSQPFKICTTGFFFWFKIFMWKGYVLRNLSPEKYRVLLGFWHLLLCLKHCCWYFCKFVYTTEMLLKQNIIFFNLKM